MNEIDYDMIGYTLDTMLLMKVDSRMSMHTHMHRFRQVLNKAILMEISISMRKDME